MGIIGSLLRRLGGLDVDEVKAWGPIAVGIAAIISGLAANIILIIFQWRNNKRQAEHNERQLALLKSKEHRDEIRERLNKFYGPLKELRTQSKALYAKFELRIGKKIHREGGSEPFDILPAAISPLDKKTR